MMKLTKEFLEPARYTVGSRSWPTLRAQVAMEPRLHVSDQIIWNYVWEQIWVAIIEQVHNEIERQTS